MRLHELAKELDADSKRLLAIAKDLGLGVKSHSSNLPTGTEGILRAAWREEEEERRAAEAAAEKAEAAEAEADAHTIRVNIRSSTEAEEAEAAAPEAAPAEEAEPATESVAEAPPAETGDREAVAAAEVEEVPAADAGEEAAPAATTDDVAEAPGQPVPADEEAGEAAREAEPVEAAARAEETPEAEAEDAEGQHRMVVTFGGRPAGGEEEPAEEEGAIAASAERRSAGGDVADEDDESVKQVGRPNVPTRRERRGAKILGRIDIKPADAPPPRRREQAAYDPLDPTRAMPTRRDTGATRRDSEGKPRSGRPGKGTGDFVFDAEDNTALSAIRLGNFGNRRRPQTRRPPMRRSRVGGGRRARRSVPRPTHPVTVRAPIGVRELSLELGIKAREILQNFPGVFDPRDKNAVLDAEQLLELAVALDREINVLEPESAESRLLAHEDQRRREAAGEEVPRPPVVVVMGHVDHGKTTLLDTLRRTRIAAKEAGGITQRTSAYALETASGARVTLLDTPGHRAFTEMRARGAQVTDVAVLVVAADDGVMEQTQEAIDHARAADVPMVVAINKIDKSNADPMKVRQQLAQVEVLVEDYGGEVGVVECSATTGQGLEQLVERLALETEILELTADPSVPASGVVIDSTKDPKLGIVTTVVVQEGTLRAKDSLLAGTSVGRVRWLLDDRGKRVTEVGPSSPVQIVGFEEPPSAGVPFLVVEDLAAARAVVAERREARQAKATPEAAVDKVTLDNLFDTLEAQKVTDINVIVKTDSAGSVDVVRQTIEDVSHPEVRFRVIRSGVGGVTEDDVLLASASNALIIGFGVVPDVRARAAVQQHGVEVKYYDVIYEMTEDLEKAIEGELGTETHEEVTGHATIRAIFKVSRLGNIAGCYVTDGTIHRDSHVRLIRDSSVIHTGRLDSLKRFKEDVREVRENYECGMHIAGYNDIKEEDVIEAFTVTEVKRTLESSTPTAG